MTKPILAVVAFVGLALGSRAQGYAEGKSTMSSPNVSVNGSTCVVSFAGEVSVRQAEVVVDVDDFGEVLGIEVLGVSVLNPAMKTGRSPGGGLPSVAVDMDADAFYVRIKSGRSTSQLVRHAALAFGVSGELLGITVDIEAQCGDGTKPVGPSDN